MREKFLLEMSSSFSQSSSTPRSFIVELPTTQAPELPVPDTEPRKDSPKQSCIFHLGWSIVFVIMQVFVTISLIVCIVVLYPHSSLALTMTTTDNGVLLCADTSESNSETVMNIVMYANEKATKEPRSLSCGSLDRKFMGVYEFVYRDTHEFKSKSPKIGNNVVVLENQVMGEWITKPQKYTPTSTFCCSDSSMTFIFGKITMNNTTREINIGYSMMGICIVCALVLLIGNGYKLFQLCKKDNFTQTTNTAVTV
jgi:hypothetical protein